MLDLDLSVYHQHLELTEIEAKKYVFDPVRKKKYQALPEELVRQTWIKYLNLEYNISTSSLGVEKQFEVLHKVRRYDLVYYTKGVPFVLFEFKSFKQRINQKTCFQIASYNLQLAVPYLVLSNGLQSYAFEVNHLTEEIKEIHSLSFLNTKDKQ